MEILNRFIRFVTQIIKDYLRDVISIPATDDFDTLEGIERLTIKNHRPLRGVESPVNEIEYILQCKATQHKKNGRMDLAIACLKKSNELMDLTKRFRYQEKDYLRYIKYLRKDGQTELADIEESKLYQKHPEFKDKRISNLPRIKEQLQKCRQYKQDIIYITTNNRCPICSLYNDKKFSISGKSKKYPQVPHEFVKNGGFCTSCIVGFNICFDI